MVTEILPAMMQRHLRLPALPLRPLVIALLAVSLVACSSSDDDDAPAAGTGDQPPDDGVPPVTSPTDQEPDQDPDPDAGTGGLITLGVDATAGGFGTEPDDPANRWAYLDLDTGQALDIDDAAAEGNTDWEIAFRRVAVRLNGGASGPGSVTGGIADAQLDFYDDTDEPIVDVFVAASAAGELDAIERGVDAATIEYLDERENPGITGDGTDTAASWWIYDPAALTVNANPSVHYAVRGANGDSYARMRVTDIQQAERQISIELQPQAADEDAFGAATTWIATIDAAGGSACYNIDTASEVACDTASEQWNLQVEIDAGGREWNLWTNGGTRGDGGAGASFGPLDANGIAAFGSGDDVLVWTEDSAGGVFNAYSWYGYNLQGKNRIWPNYRVYAIDNGTDAWKLQVLRYYDEAGTSGRMQVRFAPIGVAGP